MKTVVERNTSASVYATAEELAERWHTTAASLAQQRYRGEGPACLRNGRKILYSWEAIEAYEKKNTVGAA